MWTSLWGRKHRVMRAAAAVLALGLFVAVLTACSTDAASPSAAATVTPTAGIPDKDITTVPTRTEVALLLSPPLVPPRVNRTEPALVKVQLETIEKVMTLADGVEYKFWTYNGSVPGPMIRVRQGDTIDLTIKNAADSRFPHSIDLHAVTGPGGGAVLTQTSPGNEKTFRFKALNPGLYVYHCASPLIPQHITNGMYGLILVEPKEGLPAVDREFYVMQGELYIKGALNDKGLQEFSLDKMLAETPDYVVFNGAVGSLAGDGALKANVNEKVRIYFGVGGPNLVSSFHVIGEIFDAVHQEGGMVANQHVQTTLVPSGGATWVEFTVDVPGNYILVDHSLSRLVRGAAGFLQVAGADQPHIFSGAGANTTPDSSGH